jgi:hypothetical protein
MNIDTTTTATTTPPTEAMLICCALAWQGNPLTGIDNQAATAARIVVTRTYTANTPPQILAWRTHTPPDSWAIRWAWARRITANAYPNALGLATLPHDHHELPAVHTGAPTE